MIDRRSMSARPVLAACPGALALALALGCTVDTPSTLCDTPNGSIVMIARVDDNGTNVHLELAFHAEGEDVSRPFCVDDQVRVNGRAAAALRKPNGHTVFALNLGRPASAYTVQVVRDGDTHEFQAAPVAPDFDIVAPAHRSEHSRAAPLEIAWTPALGDPATVTLLIGDTVDGVTCLAELYRESLVDDGGHQLPAATLAVGGGQIEGKSACEGFVELIRVDAVPLETLVGDPLHEDSRMIAATERAVIITSIP